MALVGSKSEDKQKLSKIGYKSYIFPLDAALKISELPFNTTIGAMLAIVYESITSESYEEAKKNLKRTLHIEVNDDKMRFITNHIGKIIHTLDTNNANKIWNNYIDKGIIMKQNRPGILYLMLDGAMLPTRSIKNEACTDENSDEKLTPNQNLPNPEDDSFEEKRAVYVENKLGVAIKNEWIHFWKHKKSGERRHRILNREYVALLGNCHNFTKYFMALAISNGYGVYENTVIISDGATWIKNMVYEHFKNTTYILDFYHLKEHVSNFAKEIFNNDQEKLSNWTDHISKLLLKSKKDVVIKEILNFGEDKLKKCKSNLVKYIENHKDCIDYATYKEKGYFIGSGAIESGHRTVLQRRMKQPGMRWNPDTAQYMLTLMAKYKSKLWGEGIVKPVCQHFGVTPQDRFPWVLSDDRHFNF
jgi:hypothetical protein